MAEDFLNGLIVIPLDAKTTNHWFQSATTSPVEHPWRKLFQKRQEPPAEITTPPDTYPPPTHYNISVRGPQQQYSKVIFKKNGQTREANKPSIHEIIRLRDVEAFRAATTKKAKCTVASQNQVDILSVRLSRLSTTSSSIRPVIYRYIDVVKSSIALLEAIHFELFMPDRLDLRFLGIPLAAVPPGTSEGDYFRVPDADLLSTPSFAVMLGKDIYPVVWEAKRIEKMKFDETDRNKHESGLSYVLKKTVNNPGSTVAINDSYDQYFLIRDTLFPDEDSRREHAIVRVTSMDMGTAQIYAVEPPKPGPNPPKKKEKKKEEEKGDASKKEDNDQKKNGKKDKKKKKKKGKKGKEETNDEEDEPKFDPRSEYLKRVCKVRTSSQRFGCVVSAVRELDAAEAERIEDRLGAFNMYGEKGDLRLMDELFRLGSRYREAVSRGGDAKDAGEMRIDESVILKTLKDQKIGRLSDCRTLLDWIYGSTVEIEDYDEPLELYKVNGDMTLNAAQSRALHLYSDWDGPRVFCILSPPGSGKTTVAAAMAADVARTRSGVQLLLSVQNVAVDNMGAALKKMDYGGGIVYNMKSTKKLDPKGPAPFDFLDQLDLGELEAWKAGTVSMLRQVISNREELDRQEKAGEPKTPTYEWQELSYEECLTVDRRNHENKLYPKILLSTVEMVMQKLYTASKLKGALACVKRVIIDEASLLTEAAFFCIIRRFPQAKIVLIGDEKQLPPFMYDETILGHELAGRPALTVAMKTGRVPVVELNEVYRAPPSLVAPYNRLAYGGRLVSKKAEGEYPLSSIGLIHSGLPQLLLIDVDGIQERNEKTMSLYNKKEVETLQRLLKKFPEEWKGDIMIICLYSEQKRRLQSVGLHKDFTILTVDSAQGKEKGIVILMTTRTLIPTKGTFFDSTERCNVAVSRQQKALIILGKAPLLTTNKPWSTVVNGDDFACIKAEDI